MPRCHLFAQFHNGLIGRIVRTDIAKRSRDGTMPPESPKKQARPVVVLAGIGSEMVGFTLAGVALDWLIGSLPVFTAILTIGGLILAMGHLMRWANRRIAP